MTPEDPGEFQRREQATAWNAFGLVASGVAVWGGVGWLLSQWLASSVPLMVGILTGAGAGSYLVWVRYGKP